MPYGFTKFNYIKKIIWQTVTKTGENDVLIYGGYAAYSILLAFFPFIIFLVAIAGMLGNTEAAQQAVEYAMAQLPPRIGDSILPVLHDILDQKSPKLLTVGIIGTLWVTSSGVEGLRFGLNKVYSVPESRPYLKRRLQSLGAVIACSLVFCVLALAVIGWPLITEFTARHFHMNLENSTLLNLLRFSVTALLLTLLFSSLYRILPNRAQHLQYTLPGAGFAALCWVILAQGFSLYLAHFDNYDVTYGSIGGLIITLVFFYYSATIMLVGAQLNMVMEEMNNKQKG